MSISSVKYFEIKIFTNNDFTDPYLLKLIKKKPGLNEYLSLIQDLNISSHNSKTILEFISNYDNFFFLPDKCDTAEPIRDKFKIENLNDPISWLSQPGGAVYLKKIKPFKYEGVIENERLMPIWDETNKFLPGNTNESNYLGYIWLHIDEKIVKLKSEEYVLIFFKKLFESINGAYGFIKNSEGEVILQLGVIPDGADCNW